MSQQPYGPPTPGLPAWNQPAPAPAPPAPPAPPRRPWYKKKRFVMPAALVGLLMLPGLVNGGNRTPTSTPAPAASASAAATTTAPASVAPTTAAAAATTKAPEPAKTTAAPAAPTQFATLNARDFKLLAKDPDSYVGKAYRIYGYVTQFDSATGTGGFRADTGPAKLKASEWYKFDQNSILAGDEALLAKIVEDDLFEAKVVVTGSYSYDTQIGGSATVPAFAVQEISVYGSKD